MRYAVVYAGFRQYFDNYDLAIEFVQTMVDQDPKYIRGWEIWGEQYVSKWAWAFAGDEIIPWLEWMPQKLHPESNNTTG